MPHETAAVSAQVLCTPYNHASCHFMQSHIRKVYACLAVTCHLHFWQNDRDLLRPTVVTRGWNGYRNKSQHRKSTMEKKIRKFSRRSSRDSNPRPFNHESGALTTELSPPQLGVLHPVNQYGYIRASGGGGWGGGERGWSGGGGGGARAGLLLFVFRLQALIYILPLCVWIMFVS